jgi:hypothetical protein
MAIGGHTLLLVRGVGSLLEVNLTNLMKTEMYNNMNLESQMLVASLTDKLPATFTRLATETRLGVYDSHTIHG